MQNLGLVHQKAPIKFMRKINGQIAFGCSVVYRSLFQVKGNSVDLKAMTICQTGNSLGTRRKTSYINSSKLKGMLDDNVEELSDVDDDDELCPVDCVREFQTDEEFLMILEKAKETNALVVVDFYRTSCGSCKYIEQGFAKICKGSGDQDAPVIFLKHNVIDEYDEQSEVADRLRIRTVPLFHFYKNGVLLEAFATRDKERILTAILKYTGSAPQEVNSVL
ncbi:thioredoxin-like 4, chloroplastic isoform X1 [Salvia miltiorrhiza]|uniref:thioredoxin-like 4, chloroplastic isoform X1 n=1 Tax=Salvia miltiorrhiza TaxID=226208 RepID=UPI0025AD469E|nr:thioredoxin-like 4, chloroplastic isoform X1 [Salvia miltiorrhiza]XP_057794490.1 thioredoxin-like 4, chloroplastic isoform X1 [Salvia miltiorrhiza]XP_057794491.1 thioredoxin-like 4, chloroplastic isoform X1 [Salvia miltiorrhiza]XP_057794492.1 thioredoxin-like 4, chloroplastic isoform X1 [Salvia miltiorrhiza]XP_057794493.1 thioredoxin-like 4, chloroplastic isoform X1 [Salvia miltiorrhiza]XP_057794494.1 thioredoxin-like 4, chloroplastic isoform X1 [Salvia miltiorrhiza]XP_057794495.1 thioredo